MSDTLYAFDADAGGAPLWTRNLATCVGATPVPIAQFAYSGNRNIVGNLGILSTPVIDQSTNTLYAVACTLESQHDGVPTARGRHHDRRAANRFRRGNFGHLQHDDFRRPYEWQRVSLVLSGNNVVFGFGALELESTANLYGGWVMAYDKRTLAQTGIFATVTSGNGGGGVWQSGRPPVVDSSGYVYLITGNGYNGTGYDGVHNFSESVFKLDPANGLTLKDWFTPGNWSMLDSLDLDLTSSGPMLVPGTSLLVGGGKTGVLYVLNTIGSGLGKETVNNSGAIQTLQISAGEMRGGPVYWQRSTANGGPLLYNWSVSDPVKAFSFNGSTFATSPSAQGTVTNQIWPGGFLTLSANGETPGSGVLWATVAASGDPERNPPVPGILYAFDAGNVATQLWNSNMNAARDSFGNLAKFVPPLVANGRVYVATWSNQVAVYGLLAPAPILTAVSPSSGPISGATAVTVTGQNFAIGAKVTFGGVAATSVVASPTQITANTPAHAQGSVNVVVTNPDGQSATLTGGFTFKAAAPIISAVSPSSGPISGATAVTVTGQNFAIGAKVTFGGVAATSVVASPTQITANTPAHAQGSVNVVVTNPDGQSATLTGGFTFKAAAPIISAVSPSSGPISGATAVTVTGQNFAIGAKVTFGGVAATSVVASPTQITANTPAHAQGSVNVVVTNPDGQSATLTGGFTFKAAAPIISAVSPSSGPISGATAVTVTGQNFASGATVSFGGARATSVVVSPTKITANTPAHAQGSVNVVVTNPDGQSATRTGGFTFGAPAPILTGVSPNRGLTAGGTSVTLTGRNFASGATVSFGGARATSAVVVSATQITAKAPAHKPGSVNIVVSNADGQRGTLSKIFTYRKH